MQSLRIVKRGLGLSTKLNQSLSKKSIINIERNFKTTTYFLNSTNSEQNEPELMRSLTNLKTSYATSTSEFHMVPHTIRDLIEMQSTQLPNNLIYGFPHQGINLTRIELKQRVDALSQNLLELGFKKGDRVAFALPNTHELAVAFLAASEIGLISVLLNPAYQLTEFEYMLKKTGVKGVFMYDSFKTLNHLELVRKLCPEIDSCAPGELNSKTLPDLKHVIILNSPLIPEKKTYKGTWQFSELSKPKSQIQNNEKPYLEIDDPCLILFTSGTTGKPKGALMTHKSLLNSAYLSTVVVGNGQGLRMICNPIPLFHIFGLSTGLLIPLLMGTSLIFPFYFPETVSTMKAIQAYKCITLRGTPTQYIDLINHPERKNHDISTLENAILGGSTAPPDLLVKMKETLKLKSIIVGYGMTETSLCHSVTTDFDKNKSFQKAFESIGRPLPFTETKITDPANGQIVPLGTDGELLIRGPHIIKEYWDDKEKTAEAFDKNGWFKTGDVCSMDHEGYLYFKSRSKDIIIRGGANLYPAEIESYLRTHPDVIDAHVFGVPDERMGEEVCVWVKSKTGAKLTEEDLKSFCKGKISHFKIPRYFKFVDSFPTNANAKVLKNVMRDAAIVEYKLKKD